MKIYVLSILLIFLLSGTSYLPGYYDYTPIIMKRSELEKSVKSTNPKPLINPGKIYIKESRIYVVERFKGIHVIDNTNPASPQNIRFIVVPGIVDVSIKGNLLFADNAVDLVSVDITDLNQLTVIDRVKNIFPEIPHPELRYVPYEFSISKRPENTVIVNWEKRSS